MSEPIRYGLADDDLGRIHPKEDGHLVMWSDYAALAADYVEVKDLHLKARIDIGNLQRELERLKETIQGERHIHRLNTSMLKDDLDRYCVDYRKLSQDYERLRAAGDQMLGTMLWAAAKNPDGPAEKRILAWINARDGNPEEPAK